MLYTHSSVLYTDMYIVSDLSQGISQSGTVTNNTSDSETV